MMTQAEINTKVANIVYTACDENERLCTYVEHGGNDLNYLRDRQRAILTKMAHELVSLIAEQVAYNVVVKVVGDLQKAKQ